LYCLDFVIDLFLVHLFLPFDFELSPYSLYFVLDFPISVMLSVEMLIHVYFSHSDVQLFVIQMQVLHRRAIIYPNHLHHHPSGFQELQSRVGQISETVHARHHMRQV